MSDPKKTERRSWIQPLLTVFAILVCIGAVWRTVAPASAKGVDELTLKYLAVAGALLLLRDVKSLAFGDYKVEFARKLEELEAKVGDAQAAAVGGGGAIPRPPASAAPAPIVTRGGAESVSDAASKAFADGQPVPGSVPDDPWKGRFGGQKISGTREIDAEVTPVGSSGLYRVRLQVRSTNPKRDPLHGTVQFFLHDTFSNDRPVVTVGPSGVAELTLTAWGAFTVGALADDGGTKLELDLAELATAPHDFKSR
ncbi:MAG TPA: pYEATS domain-containing protein [Longimicrobium sp.]